MKTLEKKSVKLTEWFTATKYLIELGFTEAEIEKAIIDSGNDVKSLTDEKGFQNIPAYLKTYEVFKESGYRYYIEEYFGNTEYKRTVAKVGIGVRIVANYQGLRHSSILFHLFSNKWKWFSRFTKEKECELKVYLSDLPISQIPNEYKDYTPSQLKKEYIVKKHMETCSRWSIYEMNRSDGEIYLSTDLGSLYVPIKALVSGDYSIIENRMHSYWEDYHGVNLKGYALNHRGRTEAEYLIDKAEDQKKNLMPLQSKEAAELKKYLIN